VERWPWLLKIRLLGDFGLERDGAVLDLGVKPPTRALDILLALAVAKDHSVSLEKLQDWLWPDLDGDQARAACEQALHRLRKLLGQADFVIQREGKLRLATDKVWVDLGAWEARLKQAQMSKTPMELERALRDFPGPLLPHDRLTNWLMPAAERLRSQFIDLTGRVAAERAAQGDDEEARSLYLRALDFYPDSVSISKALIEGRLAQGDAAGAMAEYARYERAAKAGPDGEPSPVIRALLDRILEPGGKTRRAGER